MSDRTILALVVSLLFALRLTELLLSNAQKQKGSVKYSWTTTALVLSGIFVYAGSAVEVLIWDFKLVWPLVIAGGVLCLLRISIKIWAVRTLGKAWSAFVEVREGQRLVQDGPYRFVRHPVYLSAFFEVVCIPMISCAPIIAAYAIFVHWALIVIRTRAEESTLRSQFGEQWDEYARRVPRFLPRL
jgi:protein-S-isoprenylcysteine O-methyltransferase Ste14